MIESLGLIIIIGIFMGIILGYYIFKKYYPEGNVYNKIEFTIFGAMGGFFIGLILSLIILTFLPYELRNVEVPIVSLMDKSGINGSFILGFGNIGNTEYYTYYKKVGQNSYQKEKTSTYNTIIVETNEEIPKFKYQLKCKVQNKWIADHGDTCRTINKQLVVPENTIIKQFELR